MALEARCRWARTGPTVPSLPRVAGCYDAAMATSRRRLVLVAVLLGTVVCLLLLAPRLRSALLVARVAGVGGVVGRLASAAASEVVVEPVVQLPSRHGPVPARRYRPSGGVDRWVVLVPGIHSLGIEEPRLTGLARELAATGLGVVTVAAPDLRSYRITPRATDVLEDAIAWAASFADLAPDGRVGVVGVSFAGGLSLVATGRPGVRERVAFVVSFGGHGDLPRVLRYLATGVAPEAPGTEAQPPHDYGLAVVLHTLADRMVPAVQVDGLREGVRTFLLASQLTLVDRDDANAAFARAIARAEALPEPASTLLGYVNDRDVAALGARLAPLLPGLAEEPSLSVERSPALPVAPIFLLHGASDRVIPTAESVLLAEHLRSRGADVRLLVSPLITHAELDRGAQLAGGWRLVSFWADVLGR